MNIETTIIDRNRNTITVTDINEENKIKLKTELVEKIAEKSYEDEDMIAILLATIENSRRYGSTERSKNHKIPQSCLIENIPVLLKYYSIEQLCEEFEHMKYHLICRIMESADPMERFFDFL